MDNERIIYTEENLKNINCNCPNCGSTEIEYDSVYKKLRCKYCKTLFEPKDLNNVKDINLLNERVIGSGARKITSDEHLITIKCVNCGAEVVLDTSVATHTKCHWCRSVLSINNRIPNGSVPDAILPFSVTKEEAIEEIKKFVSDRKKYALPEFIEKFTPDDVLGVYLPYLLVDAKLSCLYEGRGTREVLKYNITKYDTRTDLEIYDVYRDFDLNIDDLSIESNNKLSNKLGFRTNNIINSIMPFDTNNCVKFESNYLIGYTSEKRNINIDDVNKEVEKEIKKIAKTTIETTTMDYSLGVEWNKKDIKIEGSQWIAAYLPVWLYTYCEKIGDKEIVHYIAVNARTKETMGSIPINNKKIFIEFIISEVLCILFSAIGYLLTNFLAVFLLFLMFPIAYYYNDKSKRYRNATVRYNYEYETNRKVNYKEFKDVLYETRIGVPEEDSMLMKNNNLY